MYLRYIWSEAVHFIGRFTVKIMFLDVCSNWYPAIYHKGVYIQTVFLFAVNDNWQFEVKSREKWSTSSYIIIYWMNYLSMKNMKN